MTIKNNRVDLTKNNSLFNIFLHDANITLQIDAHKKIINVNSPAETYLGASKEELLHQDLIAYCNEKNLHYPRFLNKKTIEVELLEETNHETKSILWRIVPIFLKEKVTEFFLFGKDITENKKYERSIKNVENRLELFINIVPGYHWWKDLDGRYLGCNEAIAKLLGLNSSKDVIGKTDYELAWSENADTLAENDNKVIQSGEPISGEEIITTQNNTKLTFFIVKMPLKNDLSEIVGTIGTSIDITDRKKMEKELERAKTAAETANHAKSEFLANISHDVRTPLTGIITFSRYLKEQDNLGEAERKELAGDTYHASEQLLNLLNGVLDVVSADSADSATDHDLNPKSFNLMQMIDDLIQLEKPAVKSHQLELRQSIDENIPKFIVSDKMKLHRILLNLIGNSIKFTEKGYIKLSATLQSKNKKEATVVFSVEDTGIGIPEEAQPQIFERFYKVNPSYKGRYTGNGIGLHIVQTYLRLLGGKIDFHSTFGKGTTFIVSFTFPIGETPTEEAEDSSYKDMLKQEQDNILLKEQRPALETTAITTIDSINSTIKILVVDDHLYALKSLRMLFMPYKLPIVEAQNAEEALELVKKEAFDLIITDIGLPVMQGDELIAKIRQLEKETGRARGKIVALTGHAVNGGLGDECKKAGVDELFEKPMQPAFLKSLLEPLIKKKSKEKQPILEPKVEAALKEDSSPAKEGTLGTDLPDTEKQLFEINHHPLLDLNVGENVVGSKEFAKDLLKELKKEGIDPDLDNLKKAHTLGDWETVRALTHKI
ncbi:MAG: response regulator, partial [Sphingobacteriaceae bacterium]|nr:response regulator [Sphingobacteriaceae bacterium]